jgi:hypothetical protein
MALPPFFSSQNAVRISWLSASSPKNALPCPQPTYFPHHPLLVAESLPSVDLTWLGRSNPVYSTLRLSNETLGTLPRNREVCKVMLQQLVPPSRRLNSRVESKNGVWVYWECNGDRDVSRVKDMSVGGLFIETPRKKGLGAAANLHFLVQEGQIRANAIVRHVKPGGGLGLKFKAVSEKDRPHLAALMRRLRSST